MTATILRPEKFTAKRWVVDLADFINTLPDTLLLIDRAGQIHLANRAAGDFLGWEPEDLIGKPVEILVPERFRDGHSHLRERMVSKGVIRRMGKGALPILHASGRELPVEISIGQASAILGDTPLLAVTITDRYAQVQAEAALRNREAFYRELFERAPQAYQALDVEGNFIDVNQAWLELFGCKKEHVIGRFFGDFVIESSRSIVSRTFQSFVEEGFVNSPVFEACRQDTHEVFLVIVNGQVERNAKGDFVRTHCILTDVSSQVEAEEAMRRMNADLEARVRERTEELNIAREEAERANAVKTQFMTNVSHEMRTPMHSILGLSEVGRRRAGKSAPDFVDYFDMIHASGERMHALIESLLFLVNQADAERSDGSQWESIDLREFVDAIAAAHAAAAAACRQSISVDLQSSSACLAGKRDRLQQAVGYLIDNALKYSPEGAEVVLRVVDGEMPHGEGGSSVPAIVLQVIDQGCGIPEGEIKTIFEPFYQSTRTASGAGGTGLGLPLSDAIVSHHGGWLVANNRPEGGAVFTITLPCSEMRGALRQA